MDRALLELHAVATLFLAGLAWFVQIVHYPLFARVGRSRFADYEREHCRRTTWVVMPAMLSEAVLAAVLAVRLPSLGTGLGLALVVLLWISTFFLQVPLHARLERGFDDEAHARLVSTSWIRTAAWSLRALVAMSLL